MTNNGFRTKFLREAIGRVKHHIYGDFLDFGCGKGNFSCYVNRIFPVSSVVGYDPYVKEFKSIFDRKGNEGVIFSNSKEVLTSNRYDSVVSSFVLHESGSEILREIYNVVKSNGKVCIVDYNFGNIKRDNFFDAFISDCEKAEIEEYGLDYTWALHSARNLEDCVKDGEALGFKSIEANVFMDNYFLWVGQK